jgi:hypothetical protein
MGEPVQGDHRLVGKLTKVVRQSERRLPYQSAREGDGNLRRMRECAVTWADAGPVVTVIVRCDLVVCGPDVAPAAPSVEGILDGTAGAAPTRNGQVTVCCTRRLDADHTLLRGWLHPRANKESL